MSDKIFQTRCSNCEAWLGDYLVFREQSNRTLECPHCTGRLEIWVRGSGFLGWLFGYERLIP